MEKKDDANWNTLASTQEGENYKAILTGLQPETAYMYRLVYSKGSDQYASDEVMLKQKVLLLYLMVIWKRGLRMAR